MERNISNYFIYIIVYFFLLMLFLKGYYPANETGILFVGFTIFMTLSYTFASSLLTEELNLRRSEIYKKFEQLLGQTYTLLNLLKEVYLNVKGYKEGLSSITGAYTESFYENGIEKFNAEVLKNLNYHTNKQLISIYKEQLNLVKDHTFTAYLVSLKQLLEDQGDLE